MHPRSFVTIALLLGFFLALSPALMTAQETAPPPRPQAPPAPSDVAAPPADAVKTASGMFTKVVQPGKGTEKPGPSDQVTVLYSGWTADGRCFDSSALRGNRPSSFPLNNVL